MNVIKDAYGFIWDILYSVYMPYRSIVVVIILSIFSRFLLKKAYIVLNVITLNVFKVLAIIFDNFSKLFYNVVTKKFRLFKNFNDFTMMVGEKFENLATNKKNTIDKIFRKASAKIANIPLILGAIITFSLFFSYNDILKDNRIQKYFNDVMSGYTEFEKAATINRGIIPKKVIKIEEFENSVTVRRLKLNDAGINGSKVNNEPSILGSKLVEVVEGNTRLTYLNESKKDDESRTWYKVRTPSGSEGWISGKLVEFEN